MCTGQGIDLKKQRERQAHHGNPRNSQFYSGACLKPLCTEAGCEGELGSSCCDQRCINAPWTNLTPLMRTQKFVELDVCAAEWRCSFHQIYSLQDLVTCSACQHWQRLLLKWRRRSWNSTNFWVRMSGVRFVHVPFLPLCPHLTAWYFQSKIRRNQMKILRPKN